MADMLNIAVSIFVGFFVLIVVYKFLQPGFFFQLDSELRYKQLDSRIEESFNRGFINEKERILLKNELSTNSITLLRIRRRLNRIIEERNSSDQQSINDHALNPEGVNPPQREELEKESGQSGEKDVSSRTIAGNENTQIISEGDSKAAIGTGSMVAGGNININKHGIEEKEIVDRLTQEVEKRTRVEQKLENTISEFEKELEKERSKTFKKSEISESQEEKIAELTKQIERLEKEVDEFENAPQRIINLMNSAKDNFNRFSSEFRTAESIAQIMIGLAQPTGGKIYDGCCGTGQLLLEANRFAETKEQTKKLHFYGQEINPDLWKQAKVNFAIQGLDVDLGPAPDSTLHNPHHLGLSADYVIMNVPFGMRLNPKLDGSNDPRWGLSGHEEISSGDVAWILHSLHQLSPSGVCVTHLPAGILFRSDKQSVRLRKFLISEQLLSGVISLKPGMNRWTGVASIILIFEKRDLHEIKENPRGIFMMNCSKYDGIKKRGYYAFSHDEISSITDTYTNWRDARGISSVDLPPNCKVVSAEEVRENEYNLTPNSYIGV